MANCCYYARKGVAIILGAVLTGYSAWLSYEHFHSPLGPLVAVSAAVLLVLATHGRRFAPMLWALGIVAAAISATVVIDRVTATDAARLQANRDTNHPKAVALQALSDAKAELKEAAAESKAECQTGRKRRCLELERREEAARQRVATARATVAASGAQADEDPSTTLFGAWASIYRAALPLAMPVWLEIAAPVLMAYGFAPGPRKPSPDLQRKPERKPSEPLQRKPRRKRNASPRHGTRAYWLARLERERPDLAKRVRNGELTANMAAIKAGWRKSPVRLVAS
jgi:hypothetical protein